MARERNKNQWDEEPRRRQGMEDEQDYGRGTDSWGQQGEGRGYGRESHSFDEDMRSGRGRSSGYGRQGYGGGGRSGRSGYGQQSRFDWEQDQQRGYGGGWGPVGGQQGYGGMGEQQAATGRQDYGGVSGNRQGYGAMGAQQDYGMGGQWGRQGEHRGRGPKNYNRSDERIREDACDRLTDDSNVDASEVDVQVSKGEVTLSGSVSSREERRMAEDCVEGVSGVKHVQNNLRVQDKSSSATSGQKSGK